MVHYDFVSVLSGVIVATTYLYQSLTFCLGPRSSFLKLTPITLGTPLKMVAILVRPKIHKLGSKNLSPKNPLPSALPQHHPGWVTWLSKITITSLSPRLFTTAWTHQKMLPHTHHSWLKKTRHIEMQKFQS